MTQPRDALRASAITRELDLSPPARALLRDEATPEQFLAALNSQDLLDDGLLFLAHWLPRREAIWWACQCIWHLQRPVAGTKAEEEALKVAVRWVVEPNEPHRRAAEKAGEAAGTATAAGCIARGVFWSGGSISLPGLPVVEAPPRATPTIVAKALMLATAASPEAVPHRRRFLQIGHQVAVGANRWDRPRGTVPA